MKSSLIIVDAARERSLEIEVKSHASYSNTCLEKAALLGWPARRVVKTIFVSRGLEMFGFVFPELGTFPEPMHMDREEVLPRLLGISKKKSGSYSLSRCPKGMEFGTCTPFVFRKTFEEPGGIELKQVYVHELPELDDETVDISIGGVGDVAHRTSLHLPYKDIFSVLSRSFPTKVQRARLF